MYLRLFLFCLHFYFGISARLSTQLPHAERRMIDPVRLGSLEYPRNEHNSAGHWSQPEPSNSNLNDIRRPMLEARAGGNTGAAVLDKQFNKRMSKAAARWEKSLNGKALKELFSKLMASPLIEITRCLFIMTGDTQKDIFIDQLAALESLLQIISTVPPTGWENILCANDYYHRPEIQFRQIRNLHHQL